MGTASDTSRVIRASKTGKAGVFIEENSVSIVGDRRHFLVADDRGVSIRGPMSFICTSESMRKAGLFVGLNDYLETLPSTIITPLPKNNMYPPTFALANIAKDVAFFMAFLI